MLHFAVAFILRFYITTTNVRRRRQQASIVRRRRHHMRRMRSFQLLRRRNNFVMAAVVLVALARWHRLFSLRTVWVRPRSADWWDNIVNGEWTENDWRENLRMSKETFDYTCREIGPFIRRNDTRFRRAIPVDRRVAIALWRLATNIEYRTLSHIFACGRSTVCEIVHEVCQAIVHFLMTEYIRIPLGRRVQQVIDGFRDVSGFPQVGGAVDGCHIPIKAPNEYPEDYYNRKGWHSIILQAVVDHNYCFTDICVGWPGRVHDAGVFANSSLFVRGQSQTLFPPEMARFISGTRVPVQILGDAVYPLLQWLMKPYPNNGHLTPSQRRFNYKLSSTRMVVENAYGRLKGRWRCLLKRLDVATCRVPTTVGACCTLHNISETHGEAFNEDLRPSSNDDVDVGGNDGDNDARGIQYRLAGVANRIFLCYWRQSLNIALIN